MASLTQKQGLLLASIAKTPEASEQWHKDFVDASQFSNNIYKLREHGLIVKNPVSGIAKRDGNYFEYQPKPNIEFAEETEKEQLYQDILEHLAARKIEDGEYIKKNITDISKELEIPYQKTVRLVNDLEDDGALESVRKGNEKKYSLSSMETSLTRPDYSIYMITGKGVHALKEFIEDQPGILQQPLLDFYEERIVYAPKIPENVEAHNG